MAQTAADILVEVLQDWGDQALGTAGPVIVEAIVDPFTPPLPPR